MYVLNLSNIAVSQILLEVRYVTFWKKCLHFTKIKVRFSFSPVMCPSTLNCYILHFTRRCICNHGNSCEPITGNCHCPPGWLGRTCAEACSTGYYGNRCSKNCSCLNGASCGHVSGSCTCTAGWTGPTCSQACPAGFYGNDCSRKCQCNKDNTKSCDHVTGRCHCKPGYVGAR